jgi:hypothetical protein
MTLKLDLPRDVDERLQRDADRKGIAKEALAVDILTQSLNASAGSAEAGTNGSAEADFWTPQSFESLVRAQGVKPITDLRSWLDSLPEVEGADELADQMKAARLTRREQDSSYRP